MTPQERQMLTALFERIRAASNTPRDGEAEALISDELRTAPYATYLLAQSVLIQEQALGAANQRLQELEAKLQAAGNQQRPSFLGSLFGGGQQQARPTAQPMPQGAPAGYQQPQTAYQQAPQPMLAQPMMSQPQAGGGFLSGALTTAAGVAGGMLVADSIRGLFSGHSGIMGGGIMGGGLGGGETIINNYYDDSAGGSGGVDPMAVSGDTSGFGQDDTSGFGLPDTSGFGNDASDSGSLFDASGGVDFGGFMGGGDDIFEA